MLKKMKVVKLCQSTDHDGLRMPRHMTLTLLKSCTEQGILAQGRFINDRIIRNGELSDVAIASSLINMYAKRRSIIEAQRIFDCLPLKHVVTWNSLIAGYTYCGQNEEALMLYEEMKERGIEPVKVTFVCVLKGCINLAAVRYGNLIYDNIIRSGFEIDLEAGNCLIDLYAKCGFLQEAFRVFESLPVRDRVSWNSMTSGYARSGNGSSAIKLLNTMKLQGVLPDVITFSCAFQACGLLSYVNEGQCIHQQLIASGIRLDVIVGTTLVDMYVKLGKLEEAQQVFDRLANRNNIIWGTMIAGYSIHGEHIAALKLYETMQHEGVKLDIATYPCVLKSCVCIGALNEGREVHNEILVRQSDAEIDIGNALVYMYAECGILKEAQNVFNNMQNKNVMSWNLLISGYAQHENGFNALQVYEQMQYKGMMPDKITLLEALRACATIGAVIEGKMIHEQVFKCGLEFDAAVGSSLVDMYAKCGNLQEAHAVLNRLPCQDVVAYGAMIAGYVQQEQWLLAIEIYEVMKLKSIELDNVSFVCVLKSFSGVDAINDGKHVHNEVIRQSLEKDLLIVNTLIDMYAKSGWLIEAQYVFDSAPNKTLVSWNAIMSGYVQHENGVPALDLFYRLEQQDLKPNKVSFLCTLKACTNIGSSKHGMLMHNKVVQCSLENDLMICNSLIDMYSRCGNLKEAHRILHGQPNRDVISWSAMIAGYAQHGSFEMVQQQLHYMQQEGFKPVNKTFSSILSACSNAGQVKAGREFFKSMRNCSGINPSIEHCNCMVDLLGRAGHLDEANKFIQCMPNLPNISTWMSLLTSCRIFGDVAFGRYCFDHVMNLSPQNSSAFMLMSKIYADANMWVEVYKLERTRKHNSVFKKPGKACIEIVGQVQEFLVGEMNTKYFENISYKLKLSTRSMKVRGYVPLSESVLEVELPINNG